MKRKLVDIAMRFVQSDPRYTWLSRTATYDDPLGPVNPRSEAGYKAALRQANEDVRHMQGLLRDAYQTSTEMREEQRILRRVINRLDRVHDYE